MKRISVFLIMIALVVGMIGCSNGSPTQYTLSISSTTGGNVTHPGTGTFTYPAGAVVLLEVEPGDGYGFTHWSGNVSTIEDVNDLTTTITMNGHYFITANFAYGQFIQTWYDLDGIRDDMGGYYILMNDLDSTTPGYDELASDVASQGKGWQPIGYEYWDGEQWVEEVFHGTFDGQDYEIRDLFIDRPEEVAGVGIFGWVGEGGLVKNVGVVDADVTGDFLVGALVGVDHGGTVSNCYATGSVTGMAEVGGLLGSNEQVTVSSSYSTCSVTGYFAVGGLMGSAFDSTVSDSYATGNVIGEEEMIGGLLGWKYGGITDNCYATGSVSGSFAVGGLMGNNDGTVSNCYATGDVTGSEELIGGLVGDNSGTVSNSYSTGDVTGESIVGGLMGFGWGNVHNSYYNYDEVLINGENTITLGALFNADFDEWLANNKFLDVNEKLSKEGDYYVINDINDFQQLLAFGQDDSLRFRLTDDLDLSTEPNFYIPYLAGEFDGDGHTISNFDFSLDFVLPVGLFGFLTIDAEVNKLGAENVNIAGRYNIGGLVGENMGTVSDSYTTGTVTGEKSSVGGLMGGSQGTVINCYSTCNVTGTSTIGGLMGNNDGTVSNCYATGNVTGSDYRIAGLMGWNYGVVSNSHSTGNVTGSSEVGGLVGFNFGTVGNCYSTGSVTGNDYVGGLVGENNYNTTVSNCYATGTVTRSSGENTDFGGFVGMNYQGEIVNCYSMGSIHYEGAADPTDKGFAGRVDTGGDYEMTGNFWDTETSGQTSTAGNATGRTTAEMQDISTFSGAAWDIVGVANPDMRNLSYIWNIVDDETYPFLSWEP